jgi:hypothetical protein
MKQASLAMSKSSHASPLSVKSISGVSLSVIKSLCYQSVISSLSNRYTPGPTQQKLLATKLPNSFKPLAIAKHIA